MDGQGLVIMALSSARIITRSDTDDVMGGQGLIDVMGGQGLIDVMGRQELVIMALTSARIITRSDDVIDGLGIIVEVGYVIDFGPHHYTR